MPTMALTMFAIDDQVFVKIATEKRTTSNGRWCRMGIWQTNCPDCGTPFTQIHRNITFRPAHCAIRRCYPCRKPAKPVKPKGQTPNTTPSEFTSLLPASWNHVGPDANNPMSAYAKGLNVQRREREAEDRAASEARRGPRKPPPKGAFSER